MLSNIAEDLFKVFVLKNFSPILKDPMKFQSRVKRAMKEHQGRIKSSNIMAWHEKLIRICRIKYVLYELAPLYT